jgi:hypothetical protein
VSISTRDQQPNAPLSMYRTRVAIEMSDRNFQTNKIRIPRPGEIRQGSHTGEKGEIVGGSRFFAGKGAWIRRVEGLEGMSTRIREDGGRGRSRVLQNASPPTRALESAAPPSGESSPTGLRISAQGWRSIAEPTLGEGRKDLPTPKVLRPCAQMMTAWTQPRLGLDELWRIIPG